MRANDDSSYKRGVFLQRSNLCGWLLCVCVFVCRVVSRCHCHRDIWDPSPTVHLSIELVDPSANHRCFHASATAERVFRLQL